MFNQEDLLPSNQKLIDALIRIVEYRISTSNGEYSKYWNLSNIGIHNYGLIGIKINSRKLRYYEEVLSYQIDCIKMFEHDDSYVYFLVEILDTYETSGDSSFLPFDAIIKGQMIDDEYKEEEEEEGNFLENNFPKLFESYVWLKANFRIFDLDDHYGNFGIRRNETKEVICFDPIN